MTSNPTPKGGDIRVRERDARIAAHRGTIYLGDDRRQAVNSSMKAAHQADEWLMLRAERIRQGFDPLPLEAPHDHTQG